MASSSVGLTKEEKLRIQTKYKSVTPNESSARIKNDTLVTRELAKVPAGRATTRNIWKYVLQVCKSVKREIKVENAAGSDAQAKDVECLILLEKWCCSVCIELHGKKMLPTPIAVYSNLKAGSFRKHLQN